MRKSVHISMLFIAVLALSGCAVTTPLSSKNELIYAPSAKKYENITYRDDYISLAKCWDINAEKMKVNFTNSTFLNIHQEKNQAEIYVGWTATSFSTKMHYAGLVTISKKSESESIVNAYGTGEVGNTLIPKWLGTLKDCEIKGH